MGPLILQRHDGIVPIGLELSGGRAAGISEEPVPAAQILGAMILGSSLLRLANCWLWAG